MEIRGVVSFPLTTHHKYLARAEARPLKQAGVDYNKERKKKKADVDYNQERKKKGGNKKRDIFTIHKENLNFSEEIHALNFSEERVFFLIYYILPRVITTLNLNSRYNTKFHSCSNIYSIIWKHNPTIRQEKTIKITSIIQKFY